MMEWRQAAWAGTALPLETRKPMNKLVLNGAIIATGIALGILHYTLKPKPNEREIQEYAEGMSSNIEWRGQVAPDFELKATNGEEFRLSDKVGKKIIVLNFFATWCGPCREEMPELEHYYTQHKEDGLLLVGIDSDEKRDRVEEFARDLRLDFPVTIDEEAVQKQYGVSGLPTTVLIGLDGKVQFYEAGALANAEVAFDNLLRQNGELAKNGQAISTEEYRELAEKQRALPVRPGVQAAAAEEDDHLDERGKRIVARMDCPCSCEKKVQACKCGTSGKIKKALASEDFKDATDDEIIRGLNKRFCVGAS